MAADINNLLGLDNLNLNNIQDTDTILPTLFEHYHADGEVISGLNADQSYFTLNGKKISIFSGALHYFRVHPAQWRDRLRKYRAVGLNCVETYVPWNLHEPENGTFDFGEGQNKYGFSLFLDLASFIKMAQEEDLLVILRPGPYICAEWDFGGLPSWLLREPDLKIRTSCSKYMAYVERYFKKLLAEVVPLQFTKGGPIIAFQIENEYGNVKEPDKPIDTAYLEKLKSILEENGVVELLFTSDTPSNGFQGTIPGVLATANFQENASIELALLKAHQPNRPLMVMEYWTGWFDHYTENHHTRTAKNFGNVLEDILMSNSSFNLYMMHGGTNWGFMNGANIFGTGDQNQGYQPDTTSYDYDAPLSENGDYTEKYLTLQKLLSEYNDLCIRQPYPPNQADRIAYPTIDITGQLDLEDLVNQAEHCFEKETPVAMEMLDINNKSGQSYGYIVYKKEGVNIKPNSVLKIENLVSDTVLVIVNGKLVSKIFEKPDDLNEFGFWRKKDAQLNLGEKEIKNAALELVVENFGRVNYGKLYQFNQFKGIWRGNIVLNEEPLKNWKIIPLEFKSDWTKNLKNWKEPDFKSGPKLYRAVLDIQDFPPKDTYVDLKGWNKGIIIVNNFVLSRFFKIGPQQSAFLPGPLLKKGENEFLILEHFEPSIELGFLMDPVFETKGNGKILRNLL